MPTTVASHPTEELLTAHAAGQLDVGFRVLLEAHLSFCDRCAAEVAGLLSPGGQLFAALPDATPPAHLWQRLSGQLRTIRQDGGLAPDVPLPQRARAELPVVREPRPQRRFPLSPARFSVLHEDVARRVSVVLLRMPGGRRFPTHLHLGDESAVLLSGGYSDPYGHVVAGDFAHYAVGSEHGPRTDDGEVCWLVARIEGGVRFRGWRGLLQLLAR